MARSIHQIYNEMVLEKESMATLNELQPNIDNSQNLLSDLTSASMTAIWRTLFFVVAVAIWVHETLFDKHKEEIEIRANEIITGPVIWYQELCFKFQYGDSLVWNGKQYVYAVIDETKQIIKRAAVIEAFSLQGQFQVRIKVAKLDSAGLPIPLNSSELIAFKAFIAKTKFAGTNISIISLDADLLKISYDVLYDPLVMNEYGQLISDISIKPVEVAIDNHIQNLSFNGVLNLTKLTDAIQAADGVIDPVLLSAEAKYALLPYSVINKNYNANAGHMKTDPAYPLSTQINYIANV